MSKIINAWWFSTCSGQTIGIIKTKDEITGEEKFRIGIATGYNEEKDIEFIKDYGSRFLPEIIK